MRLILVLLVAFPVFGGAELDVGRAYYREGEFRKAAVHFQLALDAGEDEAAACYWAGLSYQMLGDIATPFGGRQYSKARVYLTRAMNLAPERRDYRQALFDLLLDSAASSWTSLRHAARMLRA